MSYNNNNKILKRGFFERMALISLFTQIFKKKNNADALLATNYSSVKSVPKIYFFNLLLFCKRWITIYHWVLEIAWIVFMGS